MTQIVVILRECHRNRYQPGDLAHMFKDWFYVGFHAKNHRMVVHLKDQPHTMPLDLLKVLLENAENESLMHTRYPSSTSRRPNGGPKPAKRFHHQALANKRTNAYTVHPTQLEAEPEGEPMPQPAMVVHLFEDDNILEKGTVMASS